MTINALAVASVCCLLAGCGTSTPPSGESVKMPPAMRYQPSYAISRPADQQIKDNQSAVPANSIYLGSSVMRTPRGDKKKMLSRMQVMDELKDIGVMVSPTVNDHNYIIPQYAWVKGDYNHYFDWFISRLGTYNNADGMDCDNFADFYRQYLVLANLKAKGARYGDVPCAIIVVNQKDKGMHHALNLIRTNRGWHVVEPQDGTLTALSAYKYLHNITEVTF